MGVLVRKRSGKEHLGWWVITTHRGKRKYRLVGDKAAAEQYAKKMRQTIALGDFPSKQTVPALRVFFERWLADHAKLYCKPSTYQLYAMTWRLWIAPRLGDQPLTQITRDDIRALIAHMTDAGKSRPYIKGTLAPLSAVFARAIEDQVLSRNPVARIIPTVRGDVQKRVGTALTKDQLIHLLETCRKKLPLWYPLILLYARSGLRLREALALQWGDVDFMHGCLWIRRTLTPSGQIQIPKGGRAERVDLSTQLAEVLRAAKPAHVADTDLVFPNKRGRPVNASNFRTRPWRRLFILAGIPRIRIHDLRHTFATRLLEEGENLAYVQQQLRHRSIRTTVDLYGHLQPGYNRGAVDKLDDAR